MIKTVTIVSLSSGIIGEASVQHEVEIGLRRLKEYGLKVKFGKHALDGLEQVKNHPEHRAADLLEAFRDEETDMILCAIGGDDSYRMLPYLFEHDELQNAVRKKPFLGFSDTTMSHFMLNKLDIPTFYGQAFFSDVCELDRTMLPYSRTYFEKLIRTGRIDEIRPSELWYEDREDYSPAAVGTARTAHKNTGFRLLQGPPKCKGKILGGCIDTIYDMFNGERYSDSPALCEKYGLFPGTEEWKEKLLLLETSEEKASPEKYEKMLAELQKRGVFKAVSGILMGRPIDEEYTETYEQLLLQYVNDPALPIIANISIGHSAPRCILPFGVRAEADAERQLFSFHYES